MSKAQAQGIGALEPGNGALRVHVSSQAIDERVACFSPGPALRRCHHPVVAADLVAIVLFRRFSAVLVEDSSSFGLQMSSARIDKSVGRQRPR